jgi:hypothetical protein
MTGRNSTLDAVPAGDHAPRVSWQENNWQGGNVMTKHVFDDHNIRWKTLLDLEHLHLTVLDVDRENKIVQVLYKFGGNRQIILHRHKTLNKMLVIQGEHRLYRANGELKEIRPTGSYTVSPPDDEPHREGGGEQDVIIHFTIHGEDGPMYEALDDAMNVVATVGLEDFAALRD